MLTEANFAANRKTLAANLRQQMSLPANSADWTYEQRTAYLKAFAAFVIAHPASFSEMDIYNAQSVSGATFTAMDGDSLIDNAKDFLDAAGSQAVAINADLNPFSEQNRKTTFIVAGVALVLWFVGPPLIKAYFSARSEGGAK